MTAENLDKGKVSVVTLWGAILFAMGGAWYTAVKLTNIETDIAGHTTQFTQLNDKITIMTARQESDKKEASDHLTTLINTSRESRWTYAMQQEYVRELQIGEKPDVKAIHDEFLPLTQ